MVILVSGGTSCPSTGSLSITVPGAAVLSIGSTRYRNPMRFSAARASASDRPLSAGTVTEVVGSCVVTVVVGAVVATVVVGAVGAVLGAVDGAFVLAAVVAGVVAGAWLPPASEFC